MNDALLIRVVVNVYGVIVKRVSAAVAVQDDDAADNH